MGNVMLALSSTPLTLSIISLTSPCRWESRTYFGAEETTSPETRLQMISRFIIRGKERRGRPNSGDPLRVRSVAEETQSKCVMTSCRLQYSPPQTSHINFVYGGFRQTGNFWVSFYKTLKWTFCIVSRMTRSLLCFPSLLRSAVPRCVPNPAPLY